MRQLLLLVLLVPTLAVIPVSAQNGTILYANGLPCSDSCVDAWSISQGSAVSDTFFVNGNARVTGFEIYTWEFPGDKILTIQWAITSREFGGTIYGSGTVLARSDVVLFFNDYGFNVDRVTVSGLNVEVPGGISWITLQNGIDEQQFGVYWDQNSGVGCHSPGCPSSASDNQVGMIPSESFDIHGVYLDGGDKPASAPIPTSAVYGSVPAGLAALKRILL